VSGDKAKLRDNSKEAIMYRLTRAFAVAVLLFAGSAGAEAKKAVPAKGARESSPPAEAMAAMAKAATPGVQHKALKTMTGSWSATVTMWMEPGKPPMKETAAATKKMILGDRFLAEEFSGQMMGKPFSGMGLNGYDNSKKKYVSTWVDDMTTAILYLEGTADRANKVITVEGEGIDPMTGKLKKARAVTRLVGPKKHIFEWYDLTAGKPQKSMEIVYTRQ
jgi:hypothetical protein